MHKTHVAPINPTKSETAEKKKRGKVCLKQMISLTLQQLSQQSLDTFLHLKQGAGRDND